MRSKESPRIVLTSLILASILVLAFHPLSADAASHAKTVSDGKHHWFLANHPRWRRIAKAAGCGIITGGLAAPIIGGSVAGGAVAGAAENSAIRGLKDQHDIKKKGKLDNHIW
jgi:hypothetical protein